MTAASSFCTSSWSRPLDAGPYTFIAADALVLKVREGGRVAGVHALIATGVNADGHREILGVQVSSGEDGAGWLAFLRDLTARPDRGQARHLRRARWAGRRDRGDPARGGLAALPHALRGRPHVRDPEDVLAVGASAAALGLDRAIKIKVTPVWFLADLAGPWLL